MLIVTNKKKLKKIGKITALITLLIVIIVYFFNVSYPLVLNISEAKARNLALRVVNDAGQRIRAYTVFNDSFYEYEKNNDGEVVLIRANTKSINDLYLASQLEIQKGLNELQDKVIEIPFGAFTGSSVFSGIGPLVKINMVVEGTSEAMWNSFFYNEGINQTIHRLILRIVTNINILIPMKAANITISTEFIISEDIIVGRVPDSYLTQVPEENVFDLIP